MESGLMKKRLSACRITILSLVLVFLSSYSPANAFQAVSKISIDDSDYIGE